MAGKVFRKIPSSLKNSPSKRKSVKSKAAAAAAAPSQQPTQPAKSPQQEGGGGGGGGSRPDVVPDGSLAPQTARPKDQSRGGRSVSLTRKQDLPNSLDHSPSSKNRYVSGDVVSVSDIKLEPRQEFDTPSKLSVNYSSGDPGTPAPGRRSEPGTGGATLEWRGDLQSYHETEM